MYVNLTRNTQKLLSVICLKIERLKIREILKSHKNYKMSIGLNHSQSLNVASHYFVIPIPLFALSSEVKINRL